MDSLKLLGLFLIPLLVLLDVKIIKQWLKKLLTAIKQDSLRKTLLSIPTLTYRLAAVALTILLIREVAKLIPLYLRNYPGVGTHIAMVIGLLFGSLLFYIGVSFFWGALTWKEGASPALISVFLLVLFIIPLALLSVPFRPYDRAIYQKLGYAYSVRQSRNSEDLESRDFRIYTIKTEWEFGRVGEPEVIWDFSKPPGIFGGSWNRPYEKVTKIIPFNVTEAKRVIHIAKMEMTKGWDTLIIPENLPTEMVVLENGSRLFKPEITQYDTVYYDPGLQFPNKSLMYELTSSGAILHDVAYINTATLPPVKT